MKKFALPEGVYPVHYAPDDLDAPFWAGTRDEEIRIQHCRACGNPQWGPDIICHHCHGFALEFRALAPVGTIHSWHRSWHPSHPDLKDSLPITVVIVSLDAAPKVLLIGNYLAQAGEDPRIGAAVRAVFEHHADHTLVQWSPTIK